MKDCPFCGAPGAPPAQYCHQCGRSLTSVRDDTGGDIDFAALERLRHERVRLSRELASLREISAERTLTSAERRSWNHLLAAWQEISADLTARLDVVAPRHEEDRRHEERRTKDRRREESAADGDERRSGMQRRMRQRRKGRDRRKPFPDEDQP